MFSGTAESERGFHWWVGEGEDERERNEMVHNLAAGLLIVTFTFTLSLLPGAFQEATIFSGRSALSCDMIGLGLGLGVSWGWG